jgi:organic radical activating enzyme
LNGGEPLMFKDFNKLVNLTTKTAKTYTYTNGTLSTSYYKKFIDSLENKDKFYFTISLHFKEVLRYNKLPKKILDNIALIADHIPNLKMNLVADESFQGEYLDTITQVMKKIKENTSLKYINILIADHIYEKEFDLIRLLDNKFSEFVKELDSSFEYKNCLWDNTRNTLTEMVSDIKKNAALKIAGKDFEIPYEYEVALMNFHESPKGMLVYEHLTEERRKLVIPYEELDAYIAELKPKLQMKPMRKITKLSSVGTM